MRFATFEYEGERSYGLALDDDRMVDLPRAAARLGLAALAGELLGFIVAGEPALTVARQVAATPADQLGPCILPKQAIRLLAPIPRPAKNLFCVGRNYRDHVSEGYRAAGKEMQLPEVPQFFSKPPTAVIGPDDPFLLDDAVTQKLDYEVELGVVIGTTGRDIPADRAFAHVFGYTVLNDITARDLQRRHDQWFKGKGLDRSCPLGPVLLHKDAVADLNALELTLTVDGERRQHATVSQMIFSIPEIIASLSAGLTLEAGDIIATGTPSGVGYAMDPPRFLQPGDHVVCSITGIGQLATPIQARPQ